MMISSIFTLILASASAIAALQNEFYLLSLRTGTSLHFNTINVRDGKLAVGGGGHPADLRLDGEALLSGESGHAYALNDESNFVSNTDLSPAHGFSILGDYLLYRNTTMFACPKDDDYWLGVDCEGGKGIQLRVLLPFSPLGKRDTDELEASYLDGPKEKRNLAQYFNDKTKPFRPPFGRNITYLTFSTRYHGAPIRTILPAQDDLSTKTTKSAHPRRRFARNYEEPSASQIEELEQIYTIATVSNLASQIPNIEEVVHSPMTSFEPHPLAGELGKRHFIQWWLSFTAGINRPKTTLTSESRTSSPPTTTSSTSATSTKSSATISSASARR